MSTEYYVGCMDCGQYVHLGARLYVTQYHDCQPMTHEIMIEFMNDIETYINDYGIWDVIVLLSFILRHIEHKCIMFTEHDIGYDDDMHYMIENVRMNEIKDHEEKV